MEKILTITGAIVLVALAVGLMITVTTYIGCAIYNWYRSYDYVGGNRIKSGITRLLSPIANGVTFVYYYMTFTDEQKKEVARLQTEPRYKPKGQISKAFIKHCIDHAERTTR